MSLPAPSPAQIAQAVAVLCSGGLVVFPTETVYGLGADARNRQAVARIFAAKGRPADHPLIVHLADARQLTQWARAVPRVAWQLAEAFWPGPLTLVLPCAQGVLAEVTGGLDTVALRVPGHPIARSLLAAFGGGIAAPSANLYGRVSPTSADHVREDLGERVDLILDGGPCAVGIESTIVELAPSQIRILRPGAITADALRCVVDIPVQSESGEATACPGRKPSHYAPNAKVILATHDDVLQKVETCHVAGLRVGVLSPRRPAGLPAQVAWLRAGADHNEQARSLYGCLRLADDLELQALVAVMPSGTGLGIALGDRLSRAAGPRESCPEPGEA